MYGRNGEAPDDHRRRAARPSDCFETASRPSGSPPSTWCRWMMLSDGYIANGAEPWPDSRRRGPARHPIEVGLPHRPRGGFQPYARDPETLARLGKPGHPGARAPHRWPREAGLTGNVSYDPENHEKMCDIRAAKVDRIQNDIPPSEVHGSDRGQAAGPRLGQHVRRSPAVASRRPREGVEVGHACTCGTSTPSPPTSARSSVASTRSWCPS